MSYLTDPRAFNVLIIVLFLLAAVRWGFAGNWAQCIYWIAGATLNVAILFMDGK